jgi:hypothetical protein
MQRDILLLTEMIDAAEQAQRLTADITVSQLETDRQRRDALLSNFTVLGEGRRTALRPAHRPVPGNRLAAADAIEEPDRPRLLVHRPGSPPHHRHRTTARLRCKSA